MCIKGNTRGADIDATIRLVFEALLRNPSTKLFEFEGTILPNINLRVTSSNSHENIRDTANIMMKIISLVMFLEHNLIAIKAEYMIV